MQRDASILTPSQLNTLARDLLEGSFPLVLVEGEIGNLSRPASGHLYFTLKDARAQVRCALFRPKSQWLSFVPREGLKVVARGRLTLYEARGDYQLVCDGLEDAGEGALRRAFEQLKARLEGEGLFDAARKRPLPAHVRRLGVLTSPSGAVVRDILSVLRRRFPLVEVDVLPVPVQGDGAAAQLRAMLQRAADSGRYDVLVLARGGGSLEDLWAFNDEALARAIATSPVPVVSAVGHETDFTLADFAADCRAPTPTAAAELAAPARDTLLDTLAAQRRQLQRQWQSALQGRQQALDLLALRLVHPAEQIARQRRQLDHLAHRLGGALAQTCARRRQALGALGQRLTVARPQTERAARRLDALAHRLDAAGHQALDERRANLARFAAALAHLNPQAVLERGYSLVTDEHGVIVRDSRTLEPNARIAVCFRHGRAEATVVATQDE